MGIKVFILSDNSGYYFVASRSTNFLTNFWKFLFSSPSSAQCFEFSFYRLVATNKIRISENQMFLIGYDSASTKDWIFTSVTFGSTTPSWASNISCTSGTWVLTGGDSIMDTNGVIYSAFTYGSTVSYLQIVAQSSSSGVVIGSRYISSFQCGFVYGKIALVDNLLSIASQWTSFRLVLYNTITSQILVSDFSGANLYSSEIDTYSGR